LPLVYIFEEARSMLVKGTVNYKNIMTALALNLFYFISAIRQERLGSYSMVSTTPGTP